MDKQEEGSIQCLKNVHIPLLQVFNSIKKAKANFALAFITKCDIGNQHY
ncbi:MAG: hypothetical protein SOV02_08380 [Streptococcus infantarius]|nr:hypothetical protein [Streptococcus infantarius]